MPIDALLMFGLAFGGLAALFTSWNNDDDGGEPAPVSHEPTEGDDVIDENSSIYTENVTTAQNHDGSTYDRLELEDDVLTLGGDDLVSFGDIPILSTGVIDLGDGNDTFEATEQTNAGLLQGGAGDDRIILGTTFDSQIDGGDGDDFIQTGAGVGSQIYGGAGNDTISFGPAVPLNEFLTTNEANNNAAWGGEGNDRFEISLSLTDADNAASAYAPEDPADDQTQLSAYANDVRDFVPGSEVLAIDPTSLTEGYEYQGYEINNTPYGNGVVLNYGVIGQPNLHLSVFIDVSTGGVALTDADLEFTNLSAAS